MFNMRLKELRIEKGLSQNELGKILNLSDRTISTYETGNREPDFETLAKIADYFNVSTDWLLGRTEQRTVKVIDKELPKEYQDAGIESMGINKSMNINELTPDLLKDILEAVKIVQQKKTTK